MSPVIYDQKLNWFEARQYCLSTYSPYAADIATFRSINISSFVNVVQPSVDLWIGAGNWRWNWMENGMKTGICKLTIAYEAWVGLDD